MPGPQIVACRVVGPARVHHGTLIDAYAQHGEVKSKDTDDSAPEGYVREGRAKKLPPGYARQHIINQPCQTDGSGTNYSDVCVRQVGDHVAAVVGGQQPIGNSGKTLYDALYRTEN